MIYPRLKLLHQLLADDGLIFISIDDNEQSNLKLILDEIFGVNNFICNFIWEKRTNRENRRVISIRHDYVICFAKNIKSKDRILPLLPMSEEALARYNNPDNDHRGLWKSDPVTAQSGHATASQFYTLVAPNGKKHLPPSGRCWLYSENVMNQAILDGRIWFGSHGNNTPRLKTFLDEKDRGLVPETLLSAKDFGTTESAKNNIKNIFLGDSKFETPKPIKLISFLINLVGKKDAIILDSFAGSGTTAHAVLKLNQEDRGSRQFLLCELEDYAETITAERVRRAMDGYGEGKAKTEGLGGAFEYFELGEPLFLENDLLNESVGIERIRQYVSYSERIPLEQQLPIENNISPSALGVNEQTLWLFNYDENVVTSLDLDFLGSLNLRELKQRPSQYVIYADKCVLETKFMQDHGITFKRIPRDILRF